MNRIPGYILPGESVNPAAQALPLRKGPRSTIGAPPQAGGVYQVSPYIAWLYSQRMTCAGWTSTPIAIRRMMVAQRRFNNATLVNTRQVDDFVTQVSAACAQAGQGATIWSGTRPAGQAAPAPVMAPPTVVSTNAQGFLVDQTGKVLTDANGNPLRYQGHRMHRARNMLVGALAIAAAVGIPAYFGSYFGTRASQ